MVSFSKKQGRGSEAVSDRQKHSMKRREYRRGLLSDERELLEYHHFFTSFPLSV
jgi:hypothetical protein